MPEETVHDSPVGWVSSHIRTYVDSGGMKGQRWSGNDTLLLTTRGRKSGKLRRTALIYGRDGDRYVVVASNGGKKANPEWYLNLLEQTEVEVQVGTDTFAAQARPAHASEKLALWDMMVKLFRHYAEFQAKTTRQIPVVIIEPR